jgi:hypothetical protein
LIEHRNRRGVGSPGERDARSVAIAAPPKAPAAPDLHKTRCCSSHWVPHVEGLLLAGQEQSFDSARDVVCFKIGPDS